MRQTRKRAGSRRRLAAAAATALCMLAPGAASAEDRPAAILTFPSENPLAEFLLSYSPALFDMGIYAARSLAEITYGQRGYDPVTKSFVVSDLHFRRDAVDVAVGRLRLNAKMLMLDDLSVDTRSLDLAPELRQSLDRLGLQVVTGNVEFGGRMNSARAAYQATLHVDVAGAGVLNAAATLDGFHVLVPVKDIEQTQLGGRPTVLGTLNHASFAYQDKGLSAAAYAIAAAQQGISAETMQAGLASMPTLVAGQILDGLPGGASPALRERALAWARNVESFLKDRGAISVSFDPPEPVPLARFQSGIFDEPLIAALNPTVSNRLDAPSAAASAPEGSVAAALAAITGIGRPQNVEAGVTALLGGAINGDLAAIDALGVAFEPGMTPAGADRGLLVAALLVARARGGAVSDAVLQDAEKGLPLEAVRASEADAAKFFGTTATGAQRAALTAQTVGTYDANGLRRMAFALYEGRGVPRDLTEAYALALVAAAAGDPLAAGLRDDLAAAARNGAAMLSPADARMRADSLWTAYAASLAAPKAAPEPTAPAARLSPSTPGVPDAPAAPTIPQTPGAN